MESRRKLIIGFAAGFIVQSKPSFAQSRTTVARIGVLDADSVIE